MAQRLDGLDWGSLVERCIDRDEDAWRTIAERLWPVIVRDLERVSRNRGLAEDLAQEVFLRLLADGCRRLRNYEIERGASFPAYVHACASNVYRGYLKSKQGRDEVRWTDLERAESEPSPSRLSESLQGRELRERIHELRPRLRTACLLYLDGLTYKEIGRIMAVTDGTVGSYLDETKKALRRGIGQPQPSHPSFGGPS